MSTIESRVVRFHKHGEPLAVLREDRVSVPDPGPGRIRIRVLAAGLNPADWELCRGYMSGDLPRGIGYDVAGVVDAVGEGVDDVSIDAVVFGAADFTGQESAGVAQEAILTTWFPVPPGISAAQVAVLPMVVQTAVWTLDAMRIEAGQTVLVHGAGGMVGFAAVQIALSRGAQVIATAGPTFAGALKSFGAAVTNYGEGMVDRVRELAPGPVDHVLDASRAGTGTIAQLTEIADDPAKVVTISNHDEARAAGARVNLDEIAGVEGFPSSTFLAGYADLVAQGRFHLPIAATFALDDWRAAVQLSVSGTPRGKVVIVP